MSRLLKITTGALLVLALAVPLSAQRFRGGGYFGGPRVFVGGPYLGWGPAYYGYPYGYGYYPYGYSNGYSNAGTVKIDTKMKGGSVYVDGGYAGETGKLKKFGLTAGLHDVEVRDTAGKTVFKEKVQVMAGKTVDIEPHS